jgi:predicted MPP superfamily phosphohydrolase
MRISLLLSILLLVVNILSDIYIIRQIPKRIKTKLFNISVWGVNTIIYALFVVFVCMVYMKNFQFISKNIELLVFFFLLLSLPKILFLLISPIDYLVKLFTKRRRYIFTIVAMVVSLLTFTLLLYGMAVGRKKLVCNSVEITSAELPKEFDRLKIVHISDLHLKSFYGDTTVISQMVDKINSLNPDIVCVTGDIVSLTADEILPYKPQLSRIKAKEGVYSIMGNHDYGDYVKWNSEEDKLFNIQKLNTYQKEMGWQMLNNGYANITNQGDTIIVIGVENWGNPPFSRYGNLNEAYKTLTDNKYKILLSHNPEHWQQVLGETNINLTLSGHTHAMQLKFVLGENQYSLASLRGEWWSGLYQRGEQSLYVNDGIGCTLFTFRVGAYPEITLITIKAQGNE